MRNLRQGRYFWYQGFSLSPSYQPYMEAQCPARQSDREGFSLPHLCLLQMPALRQGRACKRLSLMKQQRSIRVLQADTPFVFLLKPHARTRFPGCFCSTGLSAVKLPVSCDILRTAVLYIRDRCAIIDNRLSLFKYCGAVLPVQHIAKKTAPRQRCSVHHHRKFRRRVRDFRACFFCMDMV